ncbi:MAG: hypothetical protein KKD28_05665 [Chloroflexi bacterium]|nr:hypothetical protein [Chloroflexota bacterium]MBU1660942.1 hypothetical protein [Chloroflexota bacterium]
MIHLPSPLTPLPSPNIIAIVQARIDSSRLPGKVLLDIRARYPGTARHTIQVQDIVPIPMQVLRTCAARSVGVETCPECIERSRL